MAASDKPAVASEDAVAAPEPVLDAQLATVPPARRSVAELQKVLLANPVAGPPLGLVGQMKPVATVLHVLWPLMCIEQQHTRQQCTTCI